MGLKERQERDREAVSRSILDAASELFVTHGYQEVSIRKIAEKIEYSPAAIYSYFPSKDDIFFALAEEGFRLLFSYGASPRATVEGDPVDAIRAMFWRYYEFSKEHPEYFALMFLDRSVPRISKNWNRFGFVGEMRHEMIGADPAGDRLGRVPGRHRAERGVPHPADRRSTAPRRCSFATGSRTGKTPMRWRASRSKPLSRACARARGSPTSSHSNALRSTARNDSHDS